MPHSTIHAALNSGETLVFGHRGAMAYAPMNTLAAFELARAQGAHGVELDVQLSKDGQLVVLHDYTVDATTDGQGDVRNLTLPELKRLDAGTWFSSAFSGEQIPTLDEAIAEFGKTLLINVEIKSAQDESSGIEEIVAACIRQHGLQERTIVSSFDHHTLRRFRTVCPEVAIGFLHGQVSAFDIDALVADLPHEARHPWHDMINAEYMDWARENGFYINAWTINDAQRAIELQRLGVNSIITDEPDSIIRALMQC